MRKHCLAPRSRWGGGVFTQLGTAPTNPPGWALALAPSELIGLRRRARAALKAPELPRLQGVDFGQSVVAMRFSASTCIR